MIQFAHADTASLDRLGDDIAELAAHLDAATWRLLVMLREFDERGGWNSGFRTCAHWLSWRTGMDLGAAREKMRVARALETLPILSGALQRGALSYSKARALTRIATPDNEAELHELSTHGTAAQIERVARTWSRLDRFEEAEQERERHESRELSLYTDHDGTWVLHGRLDPEVGALLSRALEMAVESLNSEQDASRPQQRADAIGLIAELALASDRDRARTDRFQVVVHVDAAVSGEVSELEPGIRVSAETSRRIACDATRVTMTHAGDGTTLDVGRRTRTVSASLRRALDHRDRSCRFPGCDVRHCDAHHVKHWADGGPTSLDNLVLLCRFHHRLLHEENYYITTVAGDVAFHTPDGSCIDPAPRAATVPGDVVRRLRRQHEHAGIAIDADTAPLWHGDRLDLDLAMMAYRR